MPGWSLWLVPPHESFIEKNLAQLISGKIPKLLPQLGNVPDFAPHLTLTSLIEPEGIRDNPQEWLDQLPLGTISEIHVRFHTIVSEDFFFKRLIIRCIKDPGLASLAMQCRLHGVEEGDREKAERWVKNGYDPHCSLSYSDEEVTAEMLETVKKNLEGILTLDGQAGTDDLKEKPAIGWVGGRIWLVPTDKSIEDWKPVAERVL